MVASIDNNITYEGIRMEVKDICSFDGNQPFTMKWIDEEGKNLKHKKKFTVTF